MMICRNIFHKPGVQHRRRQPSICIPQGGKKYYNSVFPRIVYPSYCKYTNLLQYFNGSTQTTQNIHKTLSLSAFTSRIGIYYELKKLQIYLFKLLQRFRPHFLLGFKRAISFTEILDTQFSELWTNDSCYTDINHGIVPGSSYLHCSAILDKSGHLVK